MPSSPPPSPSVEEYPKARSLQPAPNTFPILNAIAPPLLPLVPPPAPTQPPSAHTHLYLSQADLALSQNAYTDLLTSAKSYRLALATLSTAASSFGSALESCARLKEARSSPLYTPSTSYTTIDPCTADPILAAAGIHHLLSNRQQILCETVYRTLEVPLLEEVDVWRRQIDEEEVAYQKEARVRAREIRKAEGEGAKLHAAKRWDVHGLRAHLVGLTGKLDAFTALHGTHAQTLLGQSQEISKKVAECSSSLVRAELEIFEGLARKGWAGGGLEELLDRGQDPFAREEEREGDGRVGASMVNGLVPVVHQSLGMPRDGEQRAAGLDDGVPLAVGERQDHDEMSIFGGEATDQSMRLFSPPPVLDSANERHASVWESERPLKEFTDGEDNPSINPQHGEGIPEETDFEHDDAGKEEPPWIDADGG